MGRGWVPADGAHWGLAVGGRVARLGSCEGVLVLIPALGSRPLEERGAISLGRIRGHSDKGRVRMRGVASQTGASCVRVCSDVLKLIKP